MIKPNPIRIGLIGTGGIATTAFGPAINQVATAQLWSILSRDTARAAAFAGKFKAASPTAAHSSLEDFLADPLLQAVIIASPDKLHAEQVIACAKAGKHVLVEKPFTTNHEEGVAAIESCRAHNVTLGVAMHLRWHSGHRKLYQMVTQHNALGAIRHIRAQCTWRAADNSNWRAHEELGRWWSMAGTGPHCIDMIRWFAGSPANQVVKRSSIVGREFWRGPHDETAVVLLRFSNGITAESITSVLFNAPSRFEVYGADNYAICEGTLSREGCGTITIGASPLRFDPVNPYAGEIADFVDAIIHDRTPEVSGEAGLEVVDDLLYAIAH